jgi:hypothetical protein
VAIADSPFGSSNTTAISTSDANGMMAVARALPGLYGVIFAVRTAPRTSSSPTASSPITAWRKVILELCLASWVESAPFQSPSRTATSRPTLLVRGGSGSGGAIEVLSCLNGVTLDLTHCSSTAGTVPARGGGAISLQPDGGRPFTVTIAHCTLHTAPSPTTRALVTAVVHLLGAPSRSCRMTKAPTTRTTPCASSIRSS